MKQKFVFSSSAQQRRLRSIAANALGRAALLLADAGTPVRVRGTNASPRRSFASAEQIVEEHFNKRSDPNHVNRQSMSDTIKLLRERPSLILETGSSAWGSDSSRLFDDYVSHFGGEFVTVDNRISPLLRLRSDLGPRSRIVCDDSVRFLHAWVADNPARKVDLVYLDSFDLDLASPTEAAAHGLLELEAIRPALGGGSLLLVDDTPATIDFFPQSERPSARQFVERTGLIPGKGMLIDVYLRDDPVVVKIHHHYQALYRFGSTA